MLVSVRCRGSNGAWLIRRRDNSKTFQVVVPAGWVATCSMDVSGEGSTARHIVVSPCGVTRGAAVTQHLPLTLGRDVGTCSMLGNSAGVG